MTFAVVNPPGRINPKYPPKRWLLGFGVYGWTVLLVYERSLDDALEAAIDWIADNEPGLLADDAVHEQFESLKKEMEEGLGRELTQDKDGDEICRLHEEAEVDTTAGDHGHYINSWEWAILAEDPDRGEVLEAKRNAE